jgi:hypothetical protein
VPTGIPYGYFPSAKFAFPRSYFARILVTDQSPNITLVGNLIHTDIDASIGYGIWYVLDIRIMPWSSNRYTLDFPVIDCWWEAFFDGIHHPQGYEVNFTYHGTPLLPCLEIRNPFIQTDQEVFNVAQAPPNYWLPAYQ